jgi:chromosome segregation ATPase
MFRSPGSPAGSLRLGVAILLFTCACSPFRRVSECKEVIGTVNPRLDAIESLTPDAGTSPARYEKIAAGYAELGEQLATLDISDAKLKGAVDDYRGLMTSTAEQCRTMAKELRRAPSSRGERTQRNRQLRQARSQARRNVANQEGFVHALNDACRTK